MIRLRLYVISVAFIVAITTMASVYIILNQAFTWTENHFEIPVEDYYKVDQITGSVAKVDNMITRSLIDCKITRAEYKMIMLEYVNEIKKRERRYRN